MSDSSSKNKDNGCGKAVNGQGSDPTIVGGRPMARSRSLQGIPRGIEVLKSSEVELPEKHQRYFDLVRETPDIFPGFFHAGIENNVLPKLELLREFGFYPRREGVAPEKTDADSCGAHSPRVNPQNLATRAWSRRLRERTFFVKRSSPAPPLQKLYMHFAVEFPGDRLESLSHKTECSLCGCGILDFWAIHLQ